MQARVIKSQANHENNDNQNIQLIHQHNRHLSNPKNINKLLIHYTNRKAKQKKEIHCVKETEGKVVVDAISTCDGDFFNLLRSIVNPAYPLPPLPPSTLKGKVVFLEKTETDWNERLSLQTVQTGLYSRIAGTSSAADGARKEQT